MRNPQSARFDQRFDELAALAYRVAFRILGSRQDAEDAAQEALARAYARWDRVEPHADPWVARVAANLALGVWRRRRTAHDRVRPARPDAQPAPVERLRLVEVLQDLPRRQREVVALRFLADFSEADVAKALRCSVGSVKQHAHRGLAALRVALAGDEEEDDELEEERDVRATR